eukprot:gene8098-24764_t
MYGADCNVWCDATATCGGHGVCGAAGTCACHGGWSGSNCGTPMKDSCRCSVWGDPHYTDWAGWAWDFHGAEAYEVYGSGGFHVTAQHGSCIPGDPHFVPLQPGHETCQHRVNLWHEGWGTTSVEVDRAGHLYVNCERKACPPTMGMVQSSQGEEWGVADSCPDGAAKVLEALLGLDPPTWQGEEGWGGAQYAPDGVTGLCNGPKDPLVK